MGQRLQRLKRFALASALVLAAPLVALGCGEDSAQEGGEMSYAMSSYPDYLDPQLSYTVEGWE